MVNIWFLLVKIQYIFILIFCLITNYSLFFKVFFLISFFIISLFSVTDSLVWYSILLLLALFFLYIFVINLCSFFCYPSSIFSLITLNNFISFIYDFFRLSFSFLQSSTYRISWSEIDSFLKFIFLLQTLRPLFLPSLFIFFFFTNDLVHLYIFIYLLIYFAFQS